MRNRNFGRGLFLIGFCAVFLGACVASEGASGDRAEARSFALTAGVRINEILANEPGSDPRGEFVEVVNVGSEPIELTGMTLSDGAFVRHTFEASTLAAGAAIAVFGGAAAIPRGVSNAVAASTGALGLGNGGDTVTLRDASGAALDAFTYDTALSSSDGVSFNRAKDGDPGASFVLHTTLSHLASSPGTRIDGTPFGANPPDAGAGDADAAPEADAAGDGAHEGDAGKSGHLRIVTGNLSSGNGQSYDPGEGGRIFRALAPDVALVQEMNFGANDDASIRSFVDAAFGTSYSYVREPGVQIPNGVVSRYPITQSGIWRDPQVSNRGFVWARIDVPGPHDLWAVSVHLLTTGGGNRDSEARSLVGQLTSHVPSGDHVVVGGDFNTASSTTLGILGAVVDVNAPVPTDQSGNASTNRFRNKHDDWVLVSASLQAFEAPTVVGSIVHPNGLVFDTRVFRPIEAATPARIGDSAAAGMQHMAVVRDFDLH